MLDEKNEILFFKIILSIEIAIILTMIFWIIMVYMILNCRSSLKSRKMMIKDV